MIPMDIAKIKAAEELANHRKPSIHTETSSPILCCSCSKELKTDAAIIYIDSDEFKSHTICTKCINSKLASSKVVYYDTFDFYHKRFKVGFIAQVVEEYRNAKNKKRA